MSEMKHTLGPWANRGRVGCSSWITTADGEKQICAAHNHDTEEGKANARLIAAAPDLLEALRDLNHDARLLLREVDTGTGAYAKTWNLSRSLETADAVIAEATGASPAGGADSAQEAK